MKTYHALLLFMLAAAAADCASSAPAQKEQPVLEETQESSPTPEVPGQGSEPKQHEGDAPAVEEAPAAEQQPSAEGETGAAEKPAAVEKKEERPPPVPPPPPEVVERFSEGVKVAASDPKTAISIFEEAVARAPNFHKGMYNLGILYESEHLDGKAAEAYLRAIRVKPDYEPAIENLARLYSRLGRQAEAEKFLLGVINRYPSLLGPRNALGKIYINKNELDAAVAEAKKVLKADEKNVDAMMNMAEAFFLQKKFELAETISGRVRTIEPGNPQASYLIGLILLKKNDKSAAIRLFEDTVKYKDDFAEAHCNLGVLYSEAHDYGPAMREFQRALNLSPGMTKAKVNLANSLRGSKQYKEAEEIYKKVIEENPGLIDVQYNLAILYFDNEIPGMDAIERLKAGMDLLRKYSEAGGKAVGKDEMDDYLKEAQKKIDNEIKKRENEAKRKVKEEERRKAEEEARAKAEEEARKKAEEEAKLKAEEDAKKKAAAEEEEAAAKLKAEEEARKMAEEEAAKQAAQSTEETKVGEEQPPPAPAEEGAKLEEAPAEQPAPEQPDEGKIGEGEK